MSSLRLALKQSLEELGGVLPPHPKTKKQDRKRPPPSAPAVPRRKRRPGDPPRKRGRPRKHPLPEAQQPKEEEQRAHNKREEEQDEKESSDENEFSDSNESFEEMMGDDSSLTHRDRTKGDDDQQEEERSQPGVEKNDDDEIARKKQKKLLKKLKRQNSAANTIQRTLSQWKKNKVVEHVQTLPRPLSPKPPKKDPEPTAQEQLRNNRSTKGIVPAPAPEIIDWIASMSVKKQRRNMSAGLRVKVRFATKVKKRDGKIVSKHKWYGGLVTAMSSGGSKIRIKYDDGTTEVAKYPDKDIVVDDEDNGSHIVSADAFIPPLNSDDDEPLEDSPHKKKKFKVPNSTPRPDDGEVPDEWKSEAKHSAPASPRSECSDKPKRTKDSELTDDAATQDGTVEEEHDDETGERPQIPQEISGHIEITRDKPIEVEEEETYHADSDDEEDEKEERSAKPQNIAKPQNVAKREREISNGTSSTDEKPPADPDSDESSDDDGPMEIIAQGTGGEVVDHAVEEDSSDEEVDEPVVAMDASMDDEADEEETIALVADSQNKAVSGHEDAPTEEEAEEDRAKEDPAMEDPPIDEEMAEDALSKEIAEPELHDDDDDVVLEEITLEKQAQKDDEKGSAPISHVEELDDNPRPFKRKKEVADDELTSPKTSGSSTPRRSSTPKPKRESPSLILSEFKNEAPDEEVAKPVSTLAKTIEVGLEGNADIKPDSPQIVSSQNSAFDKKGKPPKEKKEKQQKEAQQVMDEELFSLTPSRDATDLSMIQRSGRRAAQQANERIASRQELVIQDVFAKPKKKKVEKLEGKLAGKKRKELEGGVVTVAVAVADDENQWVQCDLCAKWRVLPSTVDVDKLPNQWYCEMNIYDPLHNSCDATEQTPEEIAKAKRKAKRRQARRARLEAEAEAVVGTAAVAASGDDVELKEKESKPRVTKSPGPEKRKKEDKSAEEGKKRASPISNGTDEDGNNSSGSNSDMDQAKDSKKPRRSRSKDEDGLAETADAAKTDAVKGKPRGRNRRGKEGKEEKGKGRKGSNKGKDDNQEWVQCEKCEKWRRLPLQISADDLPDVWYCTMNTWDPNTSTCSAIEDKADPSTHIVANFGGHGGHKLSYRSLIFGTGKKQNRPISERMRAAESLFSSHSCIDADIAGTHPTVMYANSSMFVNRSNAARAAEEREGEKISFLELMSHSNLWAELRGLNKRLNDQATNGGLRQSCATGNNLSSLSLPESLKTEMKDMVFHALGTSMMASHEVLLETQCRPWEGVPKVWTELKAICTVDSIVECLLELVNDGRVEVVPATNAQLTVLEAMPKFRRVGTTSPMPALKPEEENLRHAKKSRCMKISKPWKHSNPIS